MDILFEHKRVTKYMSKEVVTLDENDSVFNAVSTMINHNISCIVITKDSKPIGIITERDIIRRVMLENKNIKDIKIKEVMSSPLISKDSKTRINEVIELMGKYSIRRLVILDDNIIKGIITQTDIVRISNKFIEIIDIVKLYFYFLFAIGIVSGSYLLLKSGKFLW